MTDATSLPPRSALPRDVEIPVLPGVGITWYDRGGKYWARRAALALMWALALLLIVLIDVGIFSAIRHSSRTGFAVLLTIDVVVAVAVLGYFIVRTARRWNTASLPARARRAERTGSGQAGRERAGRDRGRGSLGGLAQPLYLLAVLAVAAVFLFCPALILALFLMSLMPEPLPERQARLWMAERLRERGHGTPAG